MSLLPNSFDPKTLEDTLNQQAKSASANQEQDYIQKKKRAVAGEAAGGRLMSGVSNYPLADLSAQNQQAQSGIQDQLTSSLMGVPQEDWLNQQNFSRSKSLAELIGSLNKPSDLESALSGIGNLGPLASIAGSFR